MSDDLDWIVLDRYFSGELSPSETAAIDQWVAGHPARAAELTDARVIWEAAGQRPSEQRFDVPAARAKVRAAIAESVRSHSPSPRREPTRRLTVLLPASGRMWRAAAAIAALLVGAVVWRTVKPARPAAAVDVARDQYRTSRGERRELRLPDGTLVMLGPESRLAMVSYGDTARVVRLDGDAYFDVTHDERRPFSVQAGDAVVHDLGTKFGVRAYAADRDVQVVVAEGRVSIGGHVLSKGQRAQRTSDGRVTVWTGIDPDEFLAWTRGHLVFHDTPLVEVLPQLERWYGLRVRLADSSLARLRLSGTLQTRLDQESLDLLAALLDVRIIRYGDSLILERARH